MLVYLDTSKTQCIVYRPDLYNSNTRKKPEMVQTAQIVILQGLKYKLILKLLDIFEICYMIQRLKL